MKYICKSCGRTIEIEDELLFCPFCGDNLIQEEKNISKTIDSIWGETASLKREFSVLVFSILSKLNILYQTKLNNIVQTFLTRCPEYPIYMKEVENISKCERRKDVLIQTEKLMGRIENFIKDLNTETTSESEPIIFPLEWSDHFAKYLDEVAELIAFNDEFYIINGTYFKSNKYKKEQFKEFDNELRTAFQTYIQCVNDNNIFAAFPSDWNIGNIRIRQNDISALWADLIDNTDEKNNGEKSEFEKEIDFDVAMETIKKTNSIKYNGILDEDFVPHVDGFWDGIHNICTLLKENETRSIVVPVLNIDEKMLSKVRRKIASKGFIVTDEKMEKAQKMDARLKQEK